MVGCECGCSTSWLLRLLFLSVCLLALLLACKHMSHRYIRNHFIDGTRSESRWWWWSECAGLAISMSTGPRALMEIPYASRPNNIHFNSSIDFQFPHSRLYILEDAYNWPSSSSSPYMLLLFGPMIHFDRFGFHVLFFFFCWFSNILLFVGVCIFVSSALCGAPHQLVFIIARPAACIMPHSPGSLGSKWPGEPQPGQKMIAHNKPMALFDNSSFICEPNYDIICFVFVCAYSMEKKKNDLTPASRLIRMNKNGT